MKRGIKPSAMRQWLAEKSRRSGILSALASAGLFALGALLLYVTFWILYGVVRFGLSWIGVLITHGSMLIVAGVLLGVLFLGQVTVFRRALEHYEFETGTRQVVSLTLARATGYSFLSLAAGPKTALSFVKLLVALLGIGPATVVEACRLAIQALRLYQLDVENCAPILAMLYDADAKVPFGDLFQQHPAADPEGTLRQLQNVDGVLFRTSEPPGLSLAAHLREEMSRSGFRA